MPHIRNAGGLLGLSWLVQMALFSVTAEPAGDSQPATKRLPACYADVFKTVHTKLTTIYGTPDPGTADNDIWGFSADGKLALSVSGGFVKEGPAKDSTIMLLDVESGKPLRKILVKKAGIYDLQMTPDGQRAFMALGLGEQDESETILAVWDLKKGKELKRWPYRGISKWLVLTTDGKRGLTCDEEGLVNVWDLETGKKLQTISAHPIDLRVSRDGKFAAIAVNGEKDFQIQLWNLTTGKKLRTWEEKTLGITTFNFSEDGKKLAVIMWRTVKVFDTGTGNVLATLENTGNSFYLPNMLAFSQDGKKLALVISHYGFGNFGQIDFNHPSQSVSLLDLPSCKKLWSNPLMRPPSFLTFTADKQQVIVCGPGKLFLVFDGSHGKVLRGRSGDHCGPVNSLSPSPYGMILYTASADRTIKRWNTISGKEEQTFQVHHKEITCLALSANGKLLLSGSADQSVKLWQAASGNLLYTFTGHTERVTAVAFSKNGKVALSGSMDRTGRLWDVATGKQLRLLAGHADGVSGVALAADGSLAITASEDHTLKIWDMKDQAGERKPQTLKGHQEGVLCLALSADGHYLLSGSRDRTIKLWNVKTGREIKTFRGHKNWVTNICFSPNGKLAASVSDDLTVKLLDLTSGREVDQIDLGTCGDCGRCVAFAPDGRSLLVGTANWTVLRFQLTGRTGK